MQGSADVLRVVAVSEETAASPEAAPAPDAAQTPEAGAPPDAHADNGAPSNGLADGNPSGDAGEGEKKKEGEGSFAAQVIGNASLLAAVLIYMGWNYENSLLQYFSIQSPFSIGIGTVDLALKGLAPLLLSDVPFFAALLVVVIAAATKAGPLQRILPKKVRAAIARLPQPADQMLILGILVTVITLSLTWPDVSGGSFGGWLAAHREGIYLVLALLAAGQVLTAWPVRRTAPGPFVYPLALIVAAIFTLWAGGIYADSLGNQAAQNFAAGLPQRTAVTVYSVTSLDISGPGVWCQRVPGATGYPYVCTGLRLLYAQSGTYDLLPVGWTARDGHTYILDDTNQIRVELSAGCPGPYPCG